MDWKKQTLLLLLGWIVNLSGLLSQTVPYACGTDIETQALQKEKMFEHRRDATNLLSEPSRSSALDTTRYVPLMIHICGETDSSGYISLERVFFSICKLNADYESMGIRFYLYGLQYIPNSMLYNHGANSGNPTAIYWMSLYRMPSVVNIFIGREVTANDQFLAYYTSLLDVIFSFKTGLGFNNPTLTHELGHFFTLPHTFFGWEGTSYNVESVNGKAPNAVGGRQVEKTVRGATGENCQIAADGFCGTPPDYSSSRAACPHVAPWRDPDSTLLNPDETNFMSYFNDNCQNSFSTDQEQAIILDVIARGYYFLPAPQPLSVVGRPIIIWPEQGTIAHYNNAIQLRWQAVDTASYYWVRVNRTFGNGSTFLFNVKDILTTATDAWISLAPNLEYTWIVTAITNADFCNNSPHAAAATFRTADWNVPVVNTSSDEPQIRVFPSPVTAGMELSLEITATEAGLTRINLNDLTGRTIINNIEINLETGLNLYHIDTNAISAGFYIISVETLETKYCYKLIITK